MAIYDPVPKFSPRDKRLLQLLGDLLLQHLGYENSGSNLPRDRVPISDSEAEELLGLLEKLVESKDFREKIYFIENMAGKEGDEAASREIYLSGRSRSGRSRAMSSKHWSEFQVRLGIVQGPVWGIGVQPMDFDHFAKMEERLFKELGTHPRVVSLVVRLVFSTKNDIDEIRYTDERKTLRIHSEVILPFFHKLRNRIVNKEEKWVGIYNIAAVLTVVSNASVLFTTRDWSVAGTISTMTGALMGVRRRDGID